MKKKMYQVVTFVQSHCSAHKTFCLAKFPLALQCFFNSLFFFSLTMTVEQQLMSAKPTYEKLSTYVLAPERMKDNNAHAPQESRKIEISVVR